MIVRERLDELRVGDGRPVVATLGNFDGLHRGHREIMRRITARAGETGGLATVITFHPHPLRVIAPDRAPRLLLTRDQKLALLEEMGIDAVLVIPFDLEFAAMPAEAFAREILVDRVGVAEVHVGADFRFGRNRAGDVELLRRLGREHGFVAESVPPVMDGGERISASRIRRELSLGNVEEARRLLGRPFQLVGTIVHGEGRGRTVLVPTANLSPENEFLPARGVYFTRLRWRGGDVLGLTNLGMRPTFGGRRITVETFLPGFAGDLYGERARLDFLARHREERRFASARELMDQIFRDLDAFERWKAARERDGEG